MNIEKCNVNDLVASKYNPRKNLKPSDPEYQKIKNSIEHFGYVDPIIINKDKTIISGHQRAKVLRDLEYNEIDVVIVDLNKNDEKALNIALNKIEGEWDIQLLDDLINDLKMQDYNIDFTGFDIEELNNLFNFELDGQNNEQNKYTDKVDIPQYQITGEKPNIDDLVNISKAQELIDEIKNSNLKEAEKEFLYKSAYRHYIFDYSKIAEYYAHADKEMQELMEKSALVIIDFDDAIKNGYTRLASQIEEMRQEDYYE